MTLNMLKVHTQPKITDGISAGFNKGRVMVLNCTHFEAPSTSAASYSSAGIDCSAPSVTTIMKGKPSHVLVTTLAANEVEKWVNHDTGSIESAFKSAFTAPNCRWNMPFHISA